MSSVVDPGPTVLLPNDAILAEVLGDIGERLVDAGVRVEYCDFPHKDCESPWIPARLAHADVAVFTMRTRCSAEMLRSAARLRGVVYPTIGTETLDPGVADELGIIVGHGAMPENFVGMAEAAVMLILMQSYDPIASSDVLHGRRERPAPNARAVRARLLCGRTVGLIGFGRIGRAIAERLQNWRVRLLASDPYIAADDRPAEVAFVDFDTLMRESDVVVVSVAITPETRDMVDARALSLMKPDARLINISRGEAIDERALADALREGRLGGAALDVTRIEPLPADSELRTLENCFLTPHMIGQTRDVFEAIAPVAVENIVRILRGEMPCYCRNPYTRERWTTRLRTLGVRAWMSEKGTA